MALSLNRRYFNASTLALAWAACLPTHAKGNARLLVLGDSLSAEYGLPRGSGWVALMAERLKAEGSPVQVINASISGDTTSGGRSRLAPLLMQHKPQAVIIELGGNDALRGLPLTASQANLDAMVQACQAQGAKVLLLGMQVPPNYGPDYAAQFAAMYVQVAKQRKCALVPFFLHGVADVAQADNLFQADRIHPIAAAHPQLLQNVWPQVKKIFP